MQPSTGEALREQLSYLTWQQRQSPMKRRSSFSGESSDVDLNSPALSPSPIHASDVFTNLKFGVTEVTAASESNWGTADRELVDGEMYRAEQLPNSTCSSDAGSAESSIVSCHTPLDKPNQANGVDVINAGTTDQSFRRNKQTLNGASSSLTLKPSMAPLDETNQANGVDVINAGTADQPLCRNKQTVNGFPLKPSISEMSAIQSQALIRGSPSFLYHCKRVLSVTTIWLTVVTLVKPQHFIRMCSPSRLTSVIIIVL